MSAREVVMHGAGRFSVVKKALALVFLGAFAATPAAAGQMEPPGGPDSTASRMKTLQQVYEKIATGAATTPDTGRPFADQDFSTAGTMHDLNEIFNALPSARSDGAVEAGVCSPGTFWGLGTGAWGGLDRDTRYRTGTRDCEAPTWGADPGDQTILETATASFTLTLTDGSAPNASNLSFVTTSSNPTLLPVGNVSYVWGSPTAAKWNVTLTPAAHTAGTDPHPSSSTVGIVAVDQAGNKTALKTFTLTVQKANVQPTVAPAVLPAQITSEDVPTSVIPFAVTDDHTALTSLTLSATSSNPALVDAAGIAMPVNPDASGNATIRLTPKADATGTTTITVRVTDGDGQARTPSFTLDVNAVNDPPTAGTFTYGSTITTTTATTVVGTSDYGDVDVGETLTLRLIDPASSTIGTASVAAAGPTIKYTASAGQSNKTDTFRYAVCDSHGACTVAAVTVNVNTP